MAIKSAAKLRRRTAKAKKRTSRNKAWRQGRANSPTLAPADLHLFWVTSGDNLEGRPGPLFSPGPPPTGGKPGRWISRRSLRVNDVLMLEGDDRRAIVVSLPDQLGEPPALVELKRVERVFHNPPARLMCIHLGDQVIRSTHAHRFWGHDRGWVPAEELAVGDQLRSPSGELFPITDLFDNGETEPVYNLRVADNHTYFVATPDTKQAVLVHNDYSDGAPPSAAEIASIRAEIAANRQFAAEYAAKVKFGPDLPDVGYRRPEGMPPSTAVVPTSPPISTGTAFAQGALLYPAQIGQFVSYGFRWIPIDWAARDRFLGQQYDRLGVDGDMVRATAQVTLIVGGVLASLPDEGAAELLESDLADGERDALAGWENEGGGLEAGSADERLLTGAGDTASNITKQVLPDNEPILAVVKDGKVIATSNASLSHSELVARQLGGQLPDGAKVVTIIKERGVISVMNSRTFAGNTLPAPQAVKDTILTFFE